MSDLFKITSRDLTVRVCDKPHLIEEAQKLRYSIFFEEMGGVAKNHDVITQKRDFDAYDAVCDHLIVQDETQNGRVVGTYRLLRRDPMQKIGQFYTENEFDVSGIKAMQGEVMELGRSCVHPDYRNRTAMQLLWRGIGEYVNHYDIKLMFGCASFSGIDPQEHAMSLSYLQHFHQTPQPLCPVSKKPVNFTPLAPEQVSQKQAIAEMPTLVKGYLRLHGSFGAGLYLDEECHCIDVAVVVQTDLLQDKHVKRYGTRS